MSVAVEAAPLRVLIADDSRDLRVLLRATLRLLGGFDVVGEAEDGVEAVRLAGQLKPDVVLLDLAMPVMDGLEAIPLLVGGCPGARIIVLSGFDAAQVAHQAIERGAHAYVHKGTPPLDLAATIRDVCARVMDRPAPPPDHAREAAARPDVAVAVPEGTGLLWSALSTMPIPAALTLADGRFVRANHGFCELAGRSERELKRLAWQDVVHPEDLGADVGGVQRLLADPRDAHRVEQRLLRADGTEAWVETEAWCALDGAGRPLVVDDDGRPRFILRRAIDLGHRRRQLDELECARDDLAERQRELVRAIALVRADIATGDQEALEHLAAVERAVARIGDLLDRVATAVVTVALPPGG